MSDELFINEPCHENWEHMSSNGTGSAAQRFCQSCDKHVHHLNEMPLREREALLQKAASGESICVRFHAPSLFRQNSLDRLFHLKLSAPVLAVLSCCILMLPLAQAEENHNWSAEPRTAKSKHSKPILMGKIKMPDNPKPPQQKKTKTDNSDQDTSKKPPHEPIKMGRLELPTRPADPPKK